MKIIMKYVGGKFNQINDIVWLMEKHLNCFETIVDVFGGAGIVLINVPNDWRVNKVYNDIDNDLYILFKVLQDDNKRNKLIQKLNVAFVHEQVFKDLRDDKLSVDQDPEINIAFKLLYLHNYSYFGDANTFMHHYRYKHITEFKIQNFLYVKNWIVENKDFRLIMEKYDRENVLFYLDPPYLRSGKIYKNSFKLQDFLDLKDILSKTQANYILNLSLYDNEMIDIFGEPNFIKEYKLQTSNTRNPPKPGVHWKMGFWYKFNDKKNSKINSLKNFEAVKNEDNGVII